MITSTSLFTPVFSSRLAPPLRSICGAEAGVGTPLRSSGSHAAIPGPIPLRTKRKLPGPERRRLPSMVSHP